jgi:hypothetical protein
MRGLAMLMLVVGLLTGQRPLSEFTATLLVAVVVSFVIEPRLLSHFATKEGGALSLPSQGGAGKKFADAKFAFIVGSMRVLGGMFVVIGALAALATVLNWSDSVRSLGGNSGVIGTLLFFSVFVGIGTLLLLGRHIPLMRSLRELGEQRHRARSSEGR